MSVTRSHTAIITSRLHIFIKSAFAKKSPSLVKIASYNINRLIIFFVYNHLRTNIFLQNEIVFIYIVGEN